MVREGEVRAGTADASVDVHVGLLGQHGLTGAVKLSLCRFLLVPIIP